MGLFIACILIYQFELHWVFYVIAVIFGIRRLKDYDDLHTAIRKLQSTVEERL